MATCILSGLKIPYGKKNTEHYCPRSKLPHILANLPSNRFPAIIIFNTLKAARFPCEWEAEKYDLCYNAYMNYNLNQGDRRLLRAALNGMPKINPCEKCICRTFREYCIKEH